VLVADSVHSSPAFAHLQSIRTAGRIVVIDGAMGTELEARGVPMDDNAWCGLANMVNVMHTDIDDVGAGIRMVRDLWSGPLGVYPHGGIWKQPNWTFLDVPVLQLECTRAAAAHTCYLHRHLEAR
jgi:hypothetical protein